MENMDTVYLLRECDAGTKMAVTSIDEILESVCDPSLKQLLIKSKEQHKKLGNEIHSLLDDCCCEEKEPTLMAKGMSWLKTNFKLTMEADSNIDSTAADLLTDGCNMGIKSLYKYLNQYPAASETAKAICKQVISVEEDLCTDLHIFL